MVGGDDAARPAMWKELRDNWIKGGCKWSSPDRPHHVGWDPREQLANLQEETNPQS